MNEKRTMKSLPEEDRPYEKCRLLGAKALSDTELLSVILRTGVKGRTALELSAQILTLCRYRAGLTGLLQLDQKELMQLSGIGPVKAAQVLCIAELSRRISRENAKQGLRVHDAATVAEYYMESLRHEEQEHLVCMMLDSANRVVGDVKLFSGTVDSAMISPREIFLKALSYHATGIILIHNHPSGDCTPSGQDRSATERVARAGELIGIRLLDHIIIGDRKYRSLMQDPE